MIKTTSMKTQTEALMSFEKRQIRQIAWTRSSGAARDDTIRRNQQARLIRRHFTAAKIRNKIYLLLREPFF